MLSKQKKYGFADMIAMSFQTSPFYSLIFAAKCIADALIPIISIFVAANFIDSAMAAYNKQADVSPVYASAALIAAIMAYNTAIGAIMGFVECRRNIYFRKKLVPECSKNRRGSNTATSKTQKPPI